ncbi:MAG: hypothetical protein FJ026_11095, partial [Chloroflexi bacterium]|nr:hypothetical protein [Chloroflexota bacterium]
MTVLYSIGSAFAGGGIGTTAYYNARGLYRYGTLRRVLCGSYRFTDIPSSLIKAVGLPDRVLRKLATYDASGRLWHLQSLLFDSWASQHLEPAEVFLCWGNYGLRSLRQARAMGMTTVLQRASAHPSVQAQLLKDEYARWGIHWSAPRATLARALAEIAEADYILIPSDFVQETFVAKRVSNNRLIQIPFG